MHSPELCVLENQPSNRIIYCGIVIHCSLSSAQVAGMITSGRDVSSVS